MQTKNKIYKTIINKKKPKFAMNKTSKNPNKYNTDNYNKLSSKNLKK